jgi:SOS-response transcriptional repressor LexA
MARPKKDNHRPGKRCRAGRWRIYWRGPDGKYEMSVGMIPDPESLYAFEVDGDSMEPIARSGQTVFALRGAWPTSGDLAFLQLEDDTAMFRRVVIVDEGRRNERWLLQPMNPAYNVREVRRKDIRLARRIRGVKF